MNVQDIFDAFVRLNAAYGVRPDEVEINFDGLVRKHTASAPIPLRDRVIKELRIQSTAGKTITLVQVNAK